MKRIIDILKGVLGAFLFTFVFIIIFSFILANTDISDNTIKPALIGMTVLSLSFNSFKTLKKIKSKGIIYGAVIGLIYLFTIFIISLFLNSGVNFSMYSYIVMIACVLSSMIGGILGVNIK